MARKPAYNIVEIKTAKDNPINSNLPPRSMINAKSEPTLIIAE